MEKLDRLYLVNMWKDLKRKESKIKKSESWPKIYFEPQTEEEKINWNKKKEKLL